MCEPITNSFLGTQPRITQVPPIRYSSAIITRAPWPAAIRAARTPPEPPPITNRSTSHSAISAPPRKISSRGSNLLAALAHLGAEFTVDHFGKTLGPLVHVTHAGLDGFRLRRQQLLAERRFVERHQILQFLFSEHAGINFRHALADFLFAAGKFLGDDHRNLAEIFLIIEVALYQRFLGPLDNIGNGVGVHGVRALQRQNFLGCRDRRRGSRRERRSRLRPGWRTAQSQSERNARGRQNSCKALHSSSPRSFGLTAVQQREFHQGRPASRCWQDR